jgi:asparagine synthase (glutamine-hydrolysing)
MLEPLARRGPDGSRIALSERAGFGHALLATTPEAVWETQPLRHTPTGCTITADVRLDNRCELAERLGVNPARTGDAELILLAYLVWDEGLVDHLRGDFAFAIWDPRASALLCARDQSGMRQLIYHHAPGRLFAFATETRALLRHPEIPVELNEARIADFLEAFEASDLTSTFFNGLSRLPPAHRLRFDRSGLRIIEYWRALPQPRLNLPSNADYTAAFRAAFDEAVRCRLRSPGPVGSMVSGGIDSSSVTAVAADLLDQGREPPLKTYSAIQSDPGCVESNAIRAALTMGHIDPALVSLDDFESYRAAMLQAASEAEEPFGWHMTLIRALYHAAQQDGIKVMLDGVGGDTTLGTGAIVEPLLRARRFLSALREIRGERRYWGVTAPSWSTHGRAFVRSLLPDNVSARRHERFLAARREAEALASPLAPAFAERIGMAQRRRDTAAQTAYPADPDEARHMRALHPYVIVARERYDRVASAFAIEPRDPFLDLRVIEFCASLPVSQLHKNGWPKLILREAMADMLPEAVRWRTGRVHLGPLFTGALWGDPPPPLTPEQRRALQPFVKPELLLPETTPGPEKALGDDGETEAALALGTCARWLIRANTAVHKGSF